jgi:hypothetical protein
MRAPIEQLVDKACGFDPAAYVPHNPWDDYWQDPKHRLVLECPKCRHAIVVERHPSDPIAAAKITYPCPRCHEFWKDKVVHYFDKDGKPVAAPWEAQG